MAPRLTCRSPRVAPGQNTPVSGGRGRDGLRRCNSRDGVGLVVTADRHGVRRELDAGLFERHVYPLQSRALNGAGHRRLGRKFRTDDDR